MFNTIMKNAFFQLALVTAARITRKPTRLLNLVAQSLVALRHQNLASMQASFREGLQDTGRLLAAYAQGKYRAVSPKVIVSIAAALVYFVNPFDLVPDALPALGLTDDFAILSWVCQNLSAQLNAFREWERSAVAVPV